MCGKTARTVRRGEGLGNQTFLPLWWLGGFGGSRLRCYGKSLALGYDRSSVTVNLRPFAYLDRVANLG